MVWEINYSSSVLNSQIRTIWNAHDNELISYISKTLCMHSYYILDWFQESDLLPLIENAVEETVLVEHVNKSYKRLRNSFRTSGLTRFHDEPDWGVVWWFTGHQVWHDCMVYRAEAFSVGRVREFRRFSAALLLLHAHIW